MTIELSLHSKQLSYVRKRRLRFDVKNGDNGYISAGVPLESKHRSAANTKPAENHPHYNHKYASSPNHPHIKSLLDGSSTPKNIINGFKLQTPTGAISPIKRQQLW